MNDNTEILDSQLLSFLPGRDEYADILVQSMRYSFQAGGKRIRPRLVLDFCRLCSGNTENAMPFAAAIEMIHTYSLIHDDLPCMDNDDLRRGKPTNHKVYGEANALLAGDALLTLAFETVLSEKAVSLNGCEKCVKAAAVLARLSGYSGMIGGQVIDLQNENKKAGIETLKIMDEKKTGALIKAACLMGCIAAGADDKKLGFAESYAENIGLAFQITDDILDMTSDTKTLGKTVGSDVENNKSTYVSLLGIDECKRLCRELTENAVKALSGFDGDTGYLTELAYYLRDRSF